MVCFPANRPRPSGVDSASARYPSYRHWSVWVYQ